MDDVITETEADTICNTQKPPKKTLNEYAELLRIDVLRSDRVYDEYVSKGIDIERLHESMPPLLNHTGAWRRMPHLQELVRHATSLKSLQNGLNLVGSLSVST